MELIALLKLIADAQNQVAVNEKFAAVAVVLNSQRHQIHELSVMMYAMLIGGLVLALVIIFGMWWDRRYLERRIRRLEKTLKKQSQEILKV